MPDSSFPRTPEPSDPGSGRHRPPPDDEAIDFRHHAPSDEGSSGALAYHSSGSGSLSGSSVLSWSDLVKQSESPSGDALDAALADPVAEADAAFDSASDADLLREVLANEPPPSGIIQDPSGEMPAVRDEAPAADSSSGLWPLPEYDAGSNVLPEARGRDADADLFPAVAAPEGEDNSSVFGRHGAAPSGPASDAWTESSKVDLLHPNASRGAPSGALGSTAPVGPPALPKPDSGSSTSLGDAPERGAESSVVDLTSQPEVDLPFPLAVDSSVGSNLLGRYRRGDRSQRSDRTNPDSGTVDLLHPSTGDFDLASKIRSTAGAAAKEALPPTTPIDTAPQRGRAGAWVGGGALGAVAGFAVFIGLWLNGVVPDLGGPSKPIQRDPTARPPAEAALAAEARRVQEQFDDLTAKLRQANITPDQLPGVADRLARADATAEQARKAKAAHDELVAALRRAGVDLDDVPALGRRLADARTAAEAKAALDALTSRLKQAGVDPADPAAALARLTEARTAAEAEARDLSAQLARARDEARAVAAEAKTAVGRLTAELGRAETARAALAAFQGAVAQRLLSLGAVAANPSAGDMLAGLDRALYGQPAGAGRADPAAAERYYVAGRGYYGSRQYAAAYQAFDAAVKANGRDARYLYFRGLARFNLGQAREAGQDFAAANDLERKNLPYPGQVDLELERVQGAPRRALNAYRR
jgi:hypothetical protein